MSTTNNNTFANLAADAPPQRRGEVMRFLYCYLTHDRSDEVPTLNQSAADGDKHILEVTVRIDHNRESAVMIFDYNELMLDAIETADPSVYGETYDERCEMESHDLEGEMERIIEGRIGAILRDDRSSLEWTRFSD